MLAVDKHIGLQHAKKLSLCLICQHVAGVKVNVLFFFLKKWYSKGAKEKKKVPPLKSYMDITVMKMQKQFKRDMFIKCRVS